MKIYNYDKNNVYIGESLADESPLEKGVFLIPANATTAKPLDYKDGFDIKFNAEENIFMYVEKNTQSTEDEKIEEPTPEQIQAQANAEAIQALNSTDWKVIRELERLMLAGTELNTEREALRASVQ